MPKCLPALARQALGTHLRKALVDKPRHPPYLLRSGFVRDPIQGATVENSTNLTERDLDVLNILWRLESGTVAEVRAELPSPVGYTGVLKLLQLLEEKGLVRHEQEGRAYRYFATVGPEEAGGPALQRLVDRAFQGSVELALARLISGRRLKPAEVERMKRLLDGAQNKKRERNR